MTNDRPVSVLTVFPKVFEKALQSILSQQLHTNILVTEEYGFRKRISSEDAAFRLTDSACWKNFL
jgi:tRNA G37 N-methylase TrmD